MNIDPLQHLERWQSDHMKDAWRLNETNNVAYRVNKKTVDIVRDGLFSGDWGTIEEPGRALWTLRGLVGSLYQQGGRAELILELLENPTPLPDVAGHLWTSMWARQRQLMDWVKEASLAPNGLGSRLLNVFIERLPHVVKWTACNPTQLAGPKRDGYVEPAVHLEEGQVAPAIDPNYMGDKIYFSFLADLVKPRNGVSAPILERILAMDPLSGEHDQTREKSLAEVAITYKSKALMAYASSRIVNEHLEQTHGIDSKDRSLVAVLIRKRRWDELREIELIDPKYVDELGQGYFHHLISSWLPVRWDKDSSQFLERDRESMEADIPVLMEGINLLLDMGCDLRQVCTPSSTAKLVKSGPRKGLPSGIKGNMAEPGETAVESLERRQRVAIAKGRVAFPESMVNAFTSTLRATLALRDGPQAPVPEAPARARARMRC